MGSSHLITMPWYHLFFGTDKKYGLYLSRVFCQRNVLSSDQIHNWRVLIDCPQRISWFFSSILMTFSPYKETQHKKKMNDRMELTMWVKLQRTVGQAPKNRYWVKHQWSCFPRSFNDSPLKGRFGEIKQKWLPKVRFSNKLPSQKITCLKKRVHETWQQHEFGRTNGNDWIQHKSFQYLCFLLDKWPALKNIFCLIQRDMGKDWHLKNTLRYVTEI